MTFYLLEVKLFQVSDPNHLTMRWSLIKMATSMLEKGLHNITLFSLQVKMAAQGANIAFLYDV